MTGVTLNRPKASGSDKGENMNIYEKMLAITQEISTVAKNLSVESGKIRYKAVGEADVLAAVKPIEAKHGIYSYPVSRTVIDSGQMTSVSEYKGEKKETLKLFMRVETVYRFVNVENPDEYIDITAYGDGVDTQDKAPGKAMTYSDKYALLKAYKIQTGDDPDQSASEPLAAMNGMKSKIGKTKGEWLEKVVTDCGKDMAKILEYYKVKTAADLTEEQYAVIVRKVNDGGNNGKN